METALKSVDEEMNVLTAQLQSFDEKYVAGNNAFFDYSSYRLSSILTLVGNAGVEDLSRLDTLKVNMERCRAMLEDVGGA